MDGLESCSGRMRSVERRRINCSVSSSAACAAGTRIRRAAVGTSTTIKVIAHAGRSSCCAKPDSGVSDQMDAWAEGTNATNKNDDRTMITNTKTRRKKLVRLSAGNRGGANSCATRARASPPPNTGRTIAKLATNCSTLLKRLVLISPGKPRDKAINETSCRNRVTAPNTINAPMIPTPNHTALAVAAAGREKASLERVQSRPIKIVAPTTTSSCTVRRAVTLQCAIHAAPKLTAYWPQRTQAIATRRSLSVITPAVATLAILGPKARSVRPISPPGMKKAQLSMSIVRTKALSQHAASMNHGADSPMKDLATPTEKKAAMPKSANATAVALETDMKDRSVVLDNTTRTCRFGLIGGSVTLIRI